MPSGLDAIGGLPGGGDLRDFLSGTAAADYIVSPSSAGFTARGVIGGNDYSHATDAASVLQSAINALGAAGGTILLSGALAWGSVPTVPPGITSKLRILGTPGMKVTLSAAGPRFLDVGRTADFQTFQNIELADINVDCNNVLGASHSHVLFGSETGGAPFRRINYDRITIRRCRLTNVPLSDTVSRLGVSIVSGHLASSEGTQNTITNVLIEDCDFQGGNVGFFVAGAVASGGAATSGLGVNVYLDNIAIVRCRHDQGVVPTGTNSIGANFQIGGIGWGGSVRMRDCVGVNSTDVGVEVDGIQDFSGVGCTMVDSWNAKFLTRNFRSPHATLTGQAAAGLQRNEWIGCTGRNVGLNRSARASEDWANTGDATTAGFIFGELVIGDCQVIDDVTTQPISNGVLVVDCFQSNQRYTRTTIRGLSIAFNALAIASNVVFNLLAFRNNLAGGVNDIERVRVTMNGARSGGTSTIRGILLEGVATQRSTVRNLEVDIAGLTGLTATETFVWIASGVLNATTHKIAVDGAAFITAPSGGSQNMVLLGSVLTLSGVATIDRLDTVLGPSGSGFDVAFNNAAQKAATTIRNILSQRTAAGGSGPITAPTAMTGLVSNTGVTVGSVSGGKPCLVQFVQGSGAGITAVDVSTNGGTTYTNLLTQAAGAMPAGANICIGPVTPAALVRVTFATTQPTINLVPVDS